MFFENLRASLQIFISNFTASFGGWINLFFILILLGLAVLVIVRTLLAGRVFRRHHALHEPQPDPDLTAHAAESLSQMVQFATVTGDKEALRQQLDWLKTRYARVFQHTDTIFLPSGTVLVRWRAGE